MPATRATKLWVAIMMLVVLAVAISIGLMRWQTGTPRPVAGPVATACPGSAAELVNRWKTGGLLPSGFVPVTMVWCDDDAADQIVRKVAPTNSAVIHAFDASPPWLPLQSACTADGQRMPYLILVDAAGTGHVLRPQTNRCGKFSDQVWAAMKETAWTSESSTPFRR